MNKKPDQSTIKGVNDDILFYRATGLYGFLSNLYRCTVEFEGRIFRSSEDAYQFGKPRDPCVAEWIISAPKPHLCAAAGHSLLSFDIVPEWNNLKVPRMTRILNAKFSQHPDLAERLLETYPRLLIENSQTDAFWGIGKNRNGRNMLGILLMAIREKYHETEG